MCAGGFLLTVLKVGQSVSPVLVVSVVITALSDKVILFVLGILGNPCPLCFHRHFRIKFLYFTVKSFGIFYGHRNKLVGHFRENWQILSLL